MTTVAVTGASGFVGGVVLAHLRRHGMSAIALTRGTPTPFDTRSLPDLANLANGGLVDLARVDVLVHCAAVPQIRKQASADERAHLFLVNATATGELARQAAQAGVRRFVLLSSAKVNGEATPPGQAFTAHDIPSPLDDYARSKLEAERLVTTIAAASAMETVILRPPLVYGPGVKGNFAQLIRIAARGLPIPLGAVDNRRSMIAVDNLADLIVRTVDHPEAAGRILMAADAEDLSTPALIQRLATLQGARAWLPSIPPALLGMALGILGRKAIADRLLGSLRVDATETRQLLGWSPPLGVDQALRLTIEGRQGAGSET